MDLSGYICGALLRHMSSFTFTTVADIGTCV
nr:unnamed protein product [Callosobruchus analis]